MALLATPVLKFKTVSTELPALIAHLRHRDPFVRGEAALALGWMGAIAVPAVPTLVEALRPVRTSPLRPSPVQSQDCTPTTPDTQVPPSPEETSRAYAAQALGRIGPEAIQAVSALSKAALDDNEQVRQSAQQALRLVQLT